MNKTNISNQMLSKILKDMPVNFLRLDKNGVIIESRGEGLERSGLKDEQLVRINALEYYPQCKDQIGKALAGNKASYESSGVYQGASWWFLNYLFFDAIQGRGAIGFSIDVTRCQQLEEAVEESKRNYFTLLEQEKDGIGIIQEGVFKLVNKAAAKITGYTVEELVDKPFLDIIPSQYRDPIAQKYTIHLGGEEVPVRYETKIQCKNGVIKDVEVSFGIIQYKKKPALISITRDISKIKSMEEELQRAQKIEYLGILAGGIAHDFNNLLTVIIGNLSLLKIYTKSDYNVAEVLTKTDTACNQAKKLAQHLLTFAKGGEPIKKPVSFSQLLKDAIHTSLIGHMTKCNLSFPGNLWYVEIDENQMRQAVGNLIVNADQAMPQGGKIKISAENMVVKQDDGIPLKDGKYIKLSIEDSGTGIPAEHLQKIFYPYFTTKQEGGGLGLAITYSIIKKHAGYIMVKSKRGVGTTFLVYLPALKKEIFAVKEIEEMKKRPFAGRGWVLFMDDQPLIRDIAEKMLNYLGYRVETVGDGAKAVQAYKKAREFGRPFDIVILDLTVPGGIGGKESIRRLRKIDPEVKAIVTSGYSNEPIMSEYKKYGFCGIIEKPFEIEKLRKTLDGLILKKEHPA